MKDGGREHIILNRFVFGSQHTSPVCTTASIDLPLLKMTHTYYTVGDVYLCARGLEDLWLVFGTGAHNDVPCSGAGECVSVTISAVPVLL